jgi:hypothetical protein
MKPDRDIFPDKYSEERLFSRLADVTLELVNVSRETFCAATASRGGDAPKNLTLSLRPA